MGLLEANIERPACKWAEDQSWFVRKVKWPGHDGAPDRMFAKDGVIVFIEFKAPDKEAKSHQLREHKKMRKAGIEVHVCDNLDDAKRILGLG